MMPEVGCRGRQDQVAAGKIAVRLGKDCVGRGRQFLARTQRCETGADAVGARADLQPVGRAVKDIAAEVHRDGEHPIFDHHGGIGVERGHQSAAGVGVVKTGANVIEAVGRNAHVDQLPLVCKCRALGGGPVRAGRQHQHGDETSDFDFHSLAGRGLRSWKLLSPELEAHGRRTTNRGDCR